MNNQLMSLRKFGQSVWYDNISRELLVSGEIKQLVENGISGLTSNPTIFEKAISASHHYDESLRSFDMDTYDDKTAYEMLAIEDIRTAAEILRPVYDQTGSMDGYVCLEVSPYLAHDTQATIDEAKRLFATLNNPNVMIKVPATPEGIPAIRQLIAQGININVTLIFSLEAHRQVMDAYISGLEDLSSNVESLGHVSSVASFFVSRLDTSVDKILAEMSDLGNKRAEDATGKAAISNAKLAYQSFEEVFTSTRFATLKAKGAKVQRPLWASTGTKNPSYSDVLYVDNLIGPNTVNTMPPGTLNAFLDHGVPSQSLKQGIKQAQETMDILSELGIDVNSITDKLLHDGVQSFADSFAELLKNVGNKRKSLSGEKISMAHQ